MPREVKAYTCIWKCGRRSSTNRGRVVEHERTCFRNPGRMSCKTCEHESSDSDGRYCHEGPRGAEAEAAFEQHGIAFNCQAWKQR